MVSCSMNAGPWLCTIFQAQRLWSFDPLSLSALQFQIPGRGKLIGSISVRCSPSCPIRCAGEEWAVTAHGGACVLARPARPLERLYQSSRRTVNSGLVLFSVHPQRVFHVSKHSGQAFRTPAAGTWSLFGLPIVGPFKISNSCQN